MQLRAIGAELTRRFHESQRGTVRPGLTLEDGTLVVTDNYLKVRIAAGLTRNQRVRVRIDEVGSVLSGCLESDPASRIADPVGEATCPTASRAVCPALRCATTP
jgi:hypothetical protein